MDGRAVSLPRSAEAGCRKRARGGRRALCGPPRGEGVALVSPARKAAATPWD